MALCGFPSTLENLPLSDISVRRVAVWGDRIWEFPASTSKGTWGLVAVVRWVLESQAQ